MRDKHGCLSPEDGFVHSRNGVRAERRVGNSRIYEITHERVSNVGPLSYYKKAFLTLLSAVLIVSFLTFTVYTSHETDSSYPATYVRQVNEHQRYSVGEEPLPNDHAEETAGCRFEGERFNGKTRGNERKNQGKRRRRETETSVEGKYPCEMKRELCKSVLQSTDAIAKVVNDNMSRIRELSNNLGRSSARDPNSLLAMIMECLECSAIEMKNSEAVTKQTDTNTTDCYSSHDLPRRNQTKANVMNVIGLLDRKETDEIEGNSTERIDSQDNYTSTASIQEVDDTDSTTSEDTTKVTVNEKPIESTTPNAEDATETNTEARVDPTTGQSTIIANVTKIQNEGTVHPSVHPSSKGQPESGTTDLPKESARSRIGSGSGLETMESGPTARIVSNQNFLAKNGNAELNQILLPTAETIKSSQQLQLTPTMSWMPYPVCFYGPPSGGTSKQSATANQFVFPASSPAAPFPATMPRGQVPTHTGNQSPGLAPSNYVQVQAQSVQFLPMQPYGNAQKIGPTGPAIQTFPTLAGPPTSNAGRSPYYCTYIPAPTFQFPSIPGVSEFQRFQSNGNEMRKAQLKEDESSENEIKTYSGSCPLNHRQCTEDGSCISDLQWCDGRVDCNDASDETMCSCKDRIAKERLCDGYFDCPHGEDELGCFECSKDSFNCGDWSRRSHPENCVPLSQRCDGRKDCTNGKDEDDCNILTFMYIEGRNELTIGYTEGYLHRNLGGQWYPVCTPTIPWIIDACISEIGTEITTAPTIQVHSIPENAYRGPYLAENDGRIDIVPTCLNTAIYVQCPEIPCGTRLLSRQDSYPPSSFFRDTTHAREIVTEKNDNIPQLYAQTNKVLEEGTTVGSKKENDSFVGSQLRIVGGRASQPRAWPFLVAIYKDGRFHCGGVILNRDWILTAAHCLERYANHYYEVQVGILRRFSFSPMAQSRRARYVVTHPEYESEFMQNDIALILLEKPVAFNRWIRPVCLPNFQTLGNMWREEPSANTNCIAIGWGATRERGSDPDHLREVEVPILPYCKHLSDQNDAVICAGYPQGGRDACQGDSGGPLMCRNPNFESQWYVAGVVSHGEGCAQPDEPGAYTKVSRFVEWIQEVIQSQTVPTSIGSAPMERCPGYKCEGGLGKCLPVERRCDRTVDCLNGEDEQNCPARYHGSYRESVNNSESVGSISNENYTTAHSVDSTEVNTERTRKQVTPETLGSVSSDNEISAETIDERNEWLALTTFTCEELIQSIPISKRCDKVYDCEDGTDEYNCTCKEFLMNLKPKAICDGYFDCDDKTDEENCGICKETDFLCGRSRKCIPLEKKCDGAFDCPLIEDELDCLTLTNGKYIRTDIDERPYLYTDGILTRFEKGNWRPACHQPMMQENQSTSMILAQKLCTYLGFAGSESVEEIAANDFQSEVESLENIEKDNEYPATQLVSIVNDKPCSGLYIRCRPILSNSIDAHLIVDPRYGSRTYLWPWLAAVFVDGRYRCSALLLEKDWLLSSLKCTEDVELSKNYTTALFGQSPSYLFVDGPYQQISVVDKIRIIHNSDVALLHLKVPVNFTRHVQPLFTGKKIYPPSDNDTCVAVGTNDGYETKTIFLKPITENCQKCHRCFVNSPSQECTANEILSTWSGVIFCLGRSAWYPAAVFNQNFGLCNLQSLRSLISIDYLFTYITEALEEDLQPSDEAACDGFRCAIGNCVPFKRICDGIPDCRDGADENSPFCNDIQERRSNDVLTHACNRSEMRCGSGECISKSAFCDGIVDCSDGTDEPAKSTCSNYLRLTAPERLCDGVRHCFDKTDESADACSCTDASFKCKTNGLCVPQDFVCDGDHDCPDGEDEAECRRIETSSGGQPGTGEVIRQSYGVWHTECFLTPVTSDEKAKEVCKSLGYTSGSVYNESKVTKPPLIPVRDSFYMVRLNRETWVTIRDDKPLLSLRTPDEPCYRLFVKCI